MNCFEALLITSLEFAFRHMNTPDSAAPTGDTAESHAHCSIRLPPLVKATVEELKLQRQQQLEQELSSPPNSFPYELYDLLQHVDRNGLGFIISWTIDGKSFRIHDHVSFEKTILPIYFKGMSSYRSFRRQLNNYGIYQDRVSRTYSHKFLVRGKRMLCSKIVRDINHRYRPKANMSGTGKLPREKQPSQNICSSHSPSNNANDCSSSTNIKNSDDALFSENQVTAQTILSPNPVDFESINRNRKKNNNYPSNSDYDNNTLQSFLRDQYWANLPGNLLPIDVVNEIIVTFSSPEQQR